MGKTYSSIDDHLASFINQQQMFFVATAPLSSDGLVNVSPKGLDGAFKILDETTVAYLDLTGSGVETIAHLKENGRITILFCGFSGAPNLLRLYGRGQVIEPQHPEFDPLLAQFPNYPGVRSIIRVQLERIADSCGFGVPIYEYQGHRDTLVKYAETKGPEGMEEYRREKNAKSLDGLAGLGLWLSKTNRESERFISPFRRQVGA